MVYKADFQLFIERNNLKKKDIAEYLGVSASFVTQLCKGERELPADKLKQIKAEAKWDSSMFLPKPTPAPPVSQTITTNNGTAINAGGNVVIGESESDGEVIEAEAVELPIVPTAVVRQPDVRLSKWIDKYSDEVERLRLSEIIRSASMVREVKDRDMAPVLKMGQYIYLELMPKEMPIKNGRIYFVDHKKVEGFFRRLYDRGDCVECRADKPAIEPNIYPKEDIYDIYKVAGVFSTDIIDDEETLAKDQQIASLTEQLERLMTQQEVHAQNTAEALASTNEVIRQQGQLIELLKNK